MLKPIDFDDNRERFGAQSTGVEITTTKCKHDYVRKTANSFECKKCRAGWIFRGEMPELAKP